MAKSEIILHCTATRSTTEIDEQWLRKVARNRSFREIPYHIVVGRKGSIVWQQNLNLVTPHCKGHNVDSIGICLAGGVARDGVTPQDNFNEQQFIQLFAIVTEILRLFDIKKIVGHNYYCNVACPVFDVEKFLSEHNLLNYYK